MQVMKVNKLLQPRIMAIVGAMGAGKTLLASAMALRLKPFYTIIANYDLRIREYDILPENVSDLMFTAEKVKGKKLMVIDEFHIFSDSRLSGSHQNVLMSYFVTQTRKQDIQLIYTTQQFGQVDIRIRDNTDVMAIPDYDSATDTMNVVYMVKDWFSGQFKTSHMKQYKNLKPVFDIYSTKQLIGEAMFDRLKEAEEKAKKK